MFKHHIVRIIFLAVPIAAFFVVHVGYGQTPSVSQQEEAGFEDEIPVIEPYVHPRLKNLDTWVRPDGPLRVGIQVGHWFALEAPEEQINLRKNTGATAGTVTEWEVNLKIAEEMKKILEAKGVLVDILPTTVPPNYSADAFVAIHADGNANTTISGFKVAAPRRDYSKKSSDLSVFIEEEYAATTKLSIDPNVTGNMRGYYAFNWRKYDHSIHPLTPAAIVETGFITNVHDRSIIVRQPKKAAQGISEGILRFLQRDFPTFFISEEGKEIAN